jgi:hypothetical protein
MKRFVYLAAFLLSCLSAQPVVAQDSTPGTPGSNDSLATRRQLNRLEETVKQLQFRVQALEAGSGKSSTITSCYMKLPFSQEPIVATEPTETGARQKVLQICSRKIEPSQCLESLVQCGK